MAPLHISNQLQADLNKVTQRWLHNRPVQFGKGGFCIDLGPFNVTKVVTPNMTLYFVYDVDANGKLGRGHLLRC
jgi:hypothetical protein